MKKKRKIVQQVCNKHYTCSYYFAEINLICQYCVLFSQAVKIYIFAVDECKVIWKRLKDKYKQIKDRVARLDDEKSVPHWSLFDAMKFTDAYTNFS